MSRSSLLIALLALAPFARARADETPPAAVAKPEATVEKLGLRFSRDAELVINADQLDAENAHGAQRVIFQKNVRAVQGDMSLSCDWLEASYPKEKSGRPDKILARGAVVIKQGANEARCTDAAVDNVACTAECHATEGRALLRRGGDDVEAKAIFFDLCKGTVRAVGDVVIRVRERAGEKPQTKAGES